MAYIYQADVWCDDCGEKIKAAIARDNPDLVPRDPADESAFDSDAYPKYYDADAEDSGPQNCAGCGEQLRARSPLSTSNRPRLPRSTKTIMTDQQVDEIKAVEEELTSLIRVDSGRAIAHYVTASGLAGYRIGEADRIHKYLTRRGWTGRGARHRYANGEYLREWYQIPTDAQLTQRTIAAIAEIAEWTGMTPAQLDAYNAAHRY